jgi:hypothetical protein
VPVLKVAYPDRPPFRLLELPVAPAPEEQRIGERRVSAVR